jgi:uncharacterized protein (DUF4415 family)
MAKNDLEKLSSLPPDFQQAANPATPVIEPPKVMVSLPLDADILAYFQSETESAAWAADINGVLRHHMETHQAIEAEFEAVMAAAPLQPGR